MSQLWFQKGISSKYAVNKDALTRYLDHLTIDKKMELHSFLLLGNDRVLCERYFRHGEVNRPHAVFSISKSFLATAIGMQVDRGNLNLNDRVYSYFPEYWRLCNSEYKRKLTIRHLLTMTAGFAEKHTSAFTSNPFNLLSRLLSQEIVTEPGSVFKYQLTSGYLLSALFRRVYPAGVHQFLKNHLFSDLGIDSTLWQTCPQGIEIGSFGLSISARDLAKFGQFYLAKGIWSGRRLLSKEWVDQAISKQIDSTGIDKKDWMCGYGFCFWLCSFDEAYRADGMNGQFVVILPKRELVLVMTGDFQDMQYALDTFTDIVLSNPN